MSLAHGFYGLSKFATRNLRKLSKGGGSLGWFKKFFVKPIINPIIRRIDHAADYIRPGVKGRFRHLFRTWGRHRGAKFRHFRQNILRHPFRFAKTAIKGALITGVAGIGIPMLMKGLFGGGKGGNDEQYSSSEPQPLSAAELEKYGPSSNVHGGTGAAIIAAGAIKKGNQDNLKTRLAEVKAQQIADEKLKDHLKPVMSTMPDKLSHIYSKSSDQNEKLDKMIELLNRSNDINLESRKIATKQVELDQANVEAQLRRNSELYRTLQRMRMESSSANEDYKSIREQLQGSEKRAILRESAREQALKKSKFKSKGKGPGLLTLAALGLIGTGVIKIFDLFKEVRDRISLGFEKATDYLKHIGTSIGMISEDTSTMVDLDVAEKESRISEGKRQAMDSNRDDVTDINDFKDSDGNIDAEKAQEAGVHNPYKADKVEAALGAAGVLTGHIGTGSAKIAKKYKVPPTPAEVAAKEANPGFIKRTLDSAKNSFVGKMLSKFRSTLSSGTWAVLGKVIGTKNAGLLKGFANKVSGLAAKSVKFGTKKLPGLGLVLGLADASYRGFKEGDWVGATLSALSGIATTLPIPGVGTAISLLIDGLQVVRDMEREANLETESKNMQSTLKHAEMQGFYKPGEKGNIINEIIRKYGTGDRADERKKLAAINGILSLETEQRLKGENWSSDMIKHKRNEVLKSAGVDIRYNLHSNTLEGIKPYSEDGPETTQVNWKSDLEAPKVINSNKRINKGEKMVPKIEEPIKLENSPFGVESYLTANYKEAEKGSRNMHKGIDVAIPSGAKFKHHKNGKVIEKTNDSVKIQDNTGLQSNYYHIKSNLGVGSEVIAGKTEIGTPLEESQLPEGMKPHIHYEVLGLDKKRVNPFRYIEGDNTLIPKGSPRKYSNREGRGKVVNGMDFEDRVLYLSGRLQKEMGLNPEQAAGAIGVFTAESQLDPYAVNRMEMRKWRGTHRHNKHGRGIAQWSLDRPARFAEWHKKNKGSYKYPEETDYKTQIDFLIWEMKTHYPYYSKKIRMAINRDQAADFTLRGYENGGPNGFASIEKIDEYAKVGSGNYAHLMNNRRKYAREVEEIIKESSSRFGGGIRTIQDLLEFHKRLSEQHGLDNLEEYNRKKVLRDLDKKYSPVMQSDATRISGVDPKIIESNLDTINRLQSDSFDDEFIKDYIDVIGDHPNTYNDPTMTDEDRQRLLKENASDMERMSWEIDKNLRDSNKFQGGFGDLFTGAIKDAFLGLKALDAGANLFGGTRAEIEKDPEVELDSNKSTKESESETVTKETPTIVNSPTVKGGDQVINNVTNIFLESGGSKLAEMR